MARAMLEKNVALRDYLKANPQAKYVDVSAALSEYTYTPQEVSAMKSKMNGGGARLQGMLSTLNVAKEFVEACGSTAAALDVLAVVDKLGGTKTARELITTVVPTVEDSTEVEDVAESVVPSSEDTSKKRRNRKKNS